MSIVLMYLLIDIDKDKAFGQESISIISTLLGSTLCLFRGEAGADNLIPTKQANFKERLKFYKAPRTAGFEDGSEALLANYGLKRNNAEYSYNFSERSGGCQE